MAGFEIDITDEKSVVVLTHGCEEGSLPIGCLAGVQPGPTHSFDGNAKIANAGG